MNSSQSLPIDTLSCLYLCGAIPSNDPVNTDTTLDFTSGQCRDSQDNIDIIIPAGLTLNFSINGPGGLDSGTVSSRTMYSIFAIADSSGKLPVNVMASNYYQNNNPLLPYGYDSYRLISFWPTDADSLLELGQQIGFANDRQFIYDSPDFTNVGSGNATTYTGIDLSSFVAPPVIHPVSVNITGEIQATAGHILYIKSSPFDGDQILSVAQATGINYRKVVNVIAQPETLSSIPVPAIYYKVTNSADSANILVNNFSYSI